MARIPDAADLGMSPEPRASRPLPNVESVGSGYQRAADIQTQDANRISAATSDFGKSLGDAGERLAAADARIRSGEDAVRRAYGYGAYSEPVDAELRRVMTEEDLGQVESVQKFGQFLSDHKNKVLESHGGSPESRMMLEQRLEQMRVGYASKVGALSQEMQTKKVAGILGSRLNSIINQTIASPGNLAKSFRDLDAEIEDMGPALPPGMETQFRDAGRERIAEATVSGLIARGALNDAEIVVNMPGVSSVLGQESHKRLTNQFNSARQEISKLEMAGTLKRTEFKSIFGYDPKPGDPNWLRYNKVGDTTDNQMEEVGDPTSPTGTRLVPRSLASKPGALTPEALGQYGPGKPSAGLDIQFGPDGKPLSITTGRQAAARGQAPGLGTEGSNLVDKDLLTALSARQSMQAMGERFKPEYQEFGTRFGAWGTALKEKLGSKPAAEDKAVLEDFTAYRAEVGQFFADRMKAMGGTAITPSEAERQEAYLPKPGSGVFDGDSPTELQTKMKRMTEFTDKAIARLAYTKAKGVKFDSVGLEDMPQIIRTRASDIEKILSGGGLAGDELKNAVRTQISREFGFVGP